MRKFIRTCQSCFKRQEAKDPHTYKDQEKEDWRNLKCRKCGSEDLDYGSWQDVDEKLKPIPRKDEEEE